VSYDVELVQLPSLEGIKFPVAKADTAKLLKKPLAFKDPKSVRELLLALSGAKAGPQDAVDYVGKGLNFARLTVKSDRVFVENNCGPRELFIIHQHLAAKFPNLVILDLQSGQVHSCKSLEEWWARPL
jgi:hypothetical protein